MFHEGQWKVQAAPQFMALDLYFRQRILLKRSNRLFEIKVWTQRIIAKIGKPKVITFLLWLGVEVTDEDAVLVIT